MQDARPASLARVGIGVFSPWHLAILVLVLLLVFGPKRLPEMGRSLGKGMRELKDGITGHDQAVNTTEPPARALPTETSGPRERDSI